MEKSSFYLDSNINNTKKMRRILFISCLITAITSINLCVYANSDESVKRVRPKTCAWHEESCGVFSGSREVCVVGGDGNKCDCGEATRDC